MPSTSTVYTIGHGTHRLETLLALVDPYGVTMLVDVRSIPSSRHAPDFVKAELEHTTAAGGVGYRWLGDRLGGRPADPALWRDGRPDWDRVRASATFAAGMAELEGLIDVATVALLCAELDPEQCHRSRLIAPELERRGHRVAHILPDGNTRLHQPVLDLR